MKIKPKELQKLSRDLKDKNYLPAMDDRDREILVTIIDIFLKKLPSIIRNL